MTATPSESREIVAALRHDVAARHLADRFGQLPAPEQHGGIGAIAGQFRDATQRMRDRPHRALPCFVKRGAFARGSSCALIDKGAEFAFGAGNGVDLPLKHGIRGPGRDRLRHLKRHAR